MHAEHNIPTTEITSAVQFSAARLWREIPSPHNLTSRLRLRLYKEVFDVREKVIYT
jgi:hypothetical protein